MPHDAPDAADPRADRRHGRGGSRIPRTAAPGLAERVWEDAALAEEFLGSPQPQLDGARPCDLTATAAGARRVEALLLRLEYSLP